MGWLERITAVLAGVATVAGVSVLVARSETRGVEPKATASAAAAAPVLTTAPPTPFVAAPEASAPAAPATGVGAITTTGVASVREHPTFASKTKGLVPPGVLAPVIEKRDGFFKVMTPFEVVGWIHGSRVETHGKAGKRPDSITEGATIVLDPGHGGHLPGAKGPLGFKEKDANLGIAKRVAEQLTGARVFLTRTDGHAGLAYRAALANRLGAHVFVSLHNNALPDKLGELPGTETYYQQRSDASKRLAGLIYEELYNALARYKVAWGRDPFAGAKYRRGQEGKDYYAVLRRTLVPAVIVEGMFITNRAEEMLLRRADVRQVYAEAVARGIKRYFKTDDPGSGFKDPYAKPTPGCPIPGCFEHRS